MAQRAVGECHQCEARASLTLFVNKIMYIKIEMKGRNMIDELIAVVNTDEPVEITPVQVPAEPTKVESQAHKDWAAAKKAFMDNYTNGQEPNADMKAIMIASIGEEPPFE